MRSPVASGFSAAARACNSIVAYKRSAARPVGPMLRTAYAARPCCPAASFCLRLVRVSFAVRQPLRCWRPPASPLA
eukprot:6179818-Pleurochrysis_carterae.AAC.1